MGHLSPIEQICHIQILKLQHHAATLTTLAQRNNCIALYCPSLLLSDGAVSPAVGDRQPQAEAKNAFKIITQVFTWVATME
ncbi:MAG: hypothetical protein V7K38_15715 [Nostoc sp.]|uniref:hypothetical protein n=1 Tax=Nostoc sp. TaxID=1180 RepID=UPI002FF768EC